MGVRACSDEEFVRLFQSLGAAETANGESILLILGEGDHTCERWELSYSLVVKLFYELFFVVMKSWPPK